MLQKFPEIPKPPGSLSWHGRLLRDRDDSDTFYARQIIGLVIGRRLVAIVNRRNV